ncbi:MAG: hypothetical protein QOJ49_179, partial [Actinomycetota bacterium]|nr:hypothetical protein [Actinomycetota bacterium]
MVRIAVGVTTALTGLTLALGMPGPA